MKDVEALFAELTEKSHDQPERSDAVRELDGVVQIGKKITEASTEVQIACADETDDAAMEISQLLHLLQVMRAVQDISLEDVSR
ncbi:hypothetical protein BH708_09600 [Brachybacterium sp. P6-10-X1]|uniref:hypothetical protein n=1 Tax=Brachybacterium sp. P6-10-X1 TaxID=1903186 RepID=UPI00097174CD|nr:hypothetical protein [Brachybacterium sp. P6-10-X1]APX32928.1 hypothetical protein BH708_09600 [Brachybacterium sp. P6-10-X1]